MAAGRLAVAHAPGDDMRCIQCHAENRTPQQAAIREGGQHARQPVVRGNLSNL
jgi:hypothetical protein